MPPTEGGLEWRGRSQQKTEPEGDHRVVWHERLCKTVWLLCLLCGFEWLYTNLFQKPRAAEPALACECVWCDGAAGRSRRRRRGTMPRSLGPWSSACSSSALWASHLWLLKSTGAIEREHKAKHPNVCEGSHWSRSSWAALPRYPQNYCKCLQTIE